jgi:hypothetical protein
MNRPDKRAPTRSIPDLDSMPIKCWQSGSGHSVRPRARTVRGGGTSGQRRNVRADPGTADGSMPRFAAVMNAMTIYRRLTAWPITSTARVIDPAASSIMRALAHGLMAEMSIGLTAGAVQKPATGSR